MYNSKKPLLRLKTDTSPPPPHTTINPSVAYLAWTSLRKIQPPFWMVVNCMLNNSKKVTINSYKNRRNVFSPLTPIAQNLSWVMNLKSRWYNNDSHLLYSTYFRLSHLRTSLSLLPSVIPQPATYNRESVTTVWRSWRWFRKKCLWVVGKELIGKIIVLFAFVYGKKNINSFQNLGTAFKT